MLKDVALYAGTCMNKAGKSYPNDQFVLQKHTIQYLSHLKLIVNQYLRWHALRVLEEAEQS